MSTIDPTRRLNYYRQPATAVMTEVEATPTGLNSKEAARRLELYGPNSFQRRPPESTIVTFFRQFKNLFVIILLVSAGFAIYLRDGKTATILSLIALMNALVGFFQEHKAETLLVSLEQLLVPRAQVVRNNKVLEIPASSLVLGDIVELQAGDSVPADLRVISEEELSTNDFALTGESNPSRKFIHAISDDVPLGSRNNMAYMSTTVATGSARGVVIGTGMHTELGRIAGLSQLTRTEASPLQREMSHLATRLIQGTAILAVLLATVALHEHLGLRSSLLFAISIAAAMIPNGLVAEVNITLAQTAARMAKAHALVKKLSAVETLGATNVILTDKTGTLTKNEMTVEQLVIGRTHYEVSGSGYEANGQILNEAAKPLSAEQLQELELFFRCGVLASNAHVNPPDTDHPEWYVIGDPTEGALITLARKAGIAVTNQDRISPELKEYQFDSARKLMSSVRQVGDTVIIYAKGAPEAILSRSTKLWDHGHERPLQAADRTYFTKYNETQASHAMRNLAFAYRVLPAGTAWSSLTFETAEKDFTFLGVASMIDPLREAVPAAMHAAHAAHVRVSVVTGDFPITARAIAVQAHLASATQSVTVINGAELPAMADSQILQLVDRGGTVFSRVAPEDKLRIVEIAKQSGAVVAVTGDGINDAPALKRADIGVAMGKTGTQVAKDAAEIILLDDSFDTLVSAIEQGRLTYANISKAARCALTDNAGELVLVLSSLVATSLFHIPMAITAIQILAIDVIAQIFPVTALGWDSAQRNLMHDVPRRLSHHIINPAALREFIGYGLLSAGLAYGNFLLFFARQHLSPRYIDASSHIYAQATILTYITIVFCQFVNLLFVRNDPNEPFFSRYLWSNKKLLIAFGLSFFCIANMVYNPLIQPYFGAYRLGFVDWLTAFGAAAIYLALRLFHRHSRKHTRRAVIALHQEVHGRQAPASV
jgi:Ca2+-transporting ATPase